MIHHTKGVTNGSAHTKRGGNMKKVTHKDVTRSTTWIKHEINVLLQKLDWWQKEKERKEGNHTIFFTNSNAGEAEAIANVKKQRKVNYQIH